MAFSNLHSPQQPFFSAASYCIFFIFIFNFKISFLGLKDCINLFFFIVKLTNFFDTFFTVLILPHFFLSLIFLLSFYCLFWAFLFPFFRTILMRNIFYCVAFVTRHIRVIKSALIISLEMHSQNFLRAESFWKLEYNIQ